MTTHDSLFTSLRSSPSFSPSTYSSHSTYSMDRRHSALGSIKGIFGRKNSRASQNMDNSNPSAPNSPFSPRSAAPNDAPNDPPPAYNPITEAKARSSPPTSPHPALMRSRGAASSSVNASTSASDDRYDFLRSFDTIFLIDDSGSMAGSRWREVSAALEAIAPICTRYDADGIDLAFLNTRPAPVHNNVTHASTVHEIFSTVRPGGGTPTGQRLNTLLKAHLAAVARTPHTPPKPVNIIVITDGEPSDDVESPIIAAAKKLDALEAAPWQIGVQFFQVGGDPDARAHLESLDDALSGMGGGCRDIVDTVPFLPGRAIDADLILKVVLGAVNKRLDRKKNPSRAA